MLPFEACGIALISKGLPYWGFYLTSWKIAFVPMVTFFCVLVHFFPMVSWLLWRFFYCGILIPSRLEMAVQFTFCCSEIFHF